FTTLLGLRLVRVVRELELYGVLEDDGRADGQVVEERRGRAERRGERVQPGHVAAFPKRVDDRGVRPQLLVLAIDLVPAAFDEMRGELRRELERVLARGEDVDGLELLLRALRHRVEGTQRLDIVAEELDADRHRRGRRVHVEDAAAARERSGLA